MTRRVAVAGARRRRDPGRASLDAIGITNQRETVVAWDPATGEPVHHALVWQDRRTAARCDELREAGPRGRWSASAPASSSTPTSPAPRSSGCCATSRRRAARSSARSTPGSSSSSPAATSPTTRTPRGRCSSTSASWRWDPELCELLGVDPDAPARAAALGRRSTAPPREFGGEVPVAGIAGDQQAALFGQACHRAGDGEEHLRHRQLRPPQHRRDGARRPADGPADDGRLGARRTRSTTRSRRPSSSPAPPSSGCATGSGSIAEAAETEALAASLDSNDGVYFVPALTGLGSPHWDPYARGTIVGLTRGSGRAHLARAALEAIAYQTVDAVRAQEAAAGRARSRS